MLQISEQKRILVLLFGVSIILIIIVFGMIALFQEGTSPSSTIQAPTTEPSPTYPNSTPIITKPTQTDTSSHAIPPVKYDTSKSAELLNKLENREALSLSDNAVKQKLIDSLNDDSGDLQITADFDLQYLKSPDEFQAEILTTDISSAKEEAVSWLEEQGMSQDGICKLPLNFYINRSISLELQDQDIIFNPLPDFCN